MDEKTGAVWRTLRKRWQKRIEALAMRVLTTFYRRMILFVYPLDIPIPTSRTYVAVDITVLTERDLTAYHSYRPDQSLTEIRARLARGDRCFACWHEGRIVDAGWVATGRVYIPYLRRSLVLDPGDIYNYDAYTLPDYRGFGLYMARNWHTGRCNRQEGYARSVALIAIENKAPRLILSRARLRPIGLYSCLRFGHWQIDWQRPWGKDVLPRLSKN